MSAGCSPYGAASALLELMVAELATARGGVPKIRAVEARPVAVMELTCSQAWTSVVSVALAEPDSEINRHCTSQWVVTLNAGAYRCYPTEDNNARPAEERIDSAVRDRLDDAEAIRRAIFKLADDDDLGGVKIGAWTPVGPSGGGHGGYWRTSVLMDLGHFSDEDVAPMPGDPRS